MSIECESSSTTIEVTSAGAMALMTNCALLSSNGMMSTRSPAISLETACTREPRMPTQAPTGSTRGSLLRTAILARTPASRAAARILMRPCPTSGTSSLNSSIRNSGAVAVDALDDAADQGARPVLVGIDHLGALRLAHLLHDDLFGGLREDTAERHRFHRFLDVAARLHILVDIARIIQAQLALRHFEFGG